MPFYVGIDVGGTTSTIAIGSHDRRLVYLSPQFPTRSQDGPDATLGDLVSAVVDGLKVFNSTLDDVITVSLATPGPATIDGTLMPSPNLRADLWANFPMRAALEKRFQSLAHAIKVIYIGDGQAAALGEFAVRSGKITASDCDSFAMPPKSEQDATLRSLFFMAVGTGLGGGEVRERVVVRGSHGRAGHAGHLLLPNHAFRYEHDRQFKVGNTVVSAESAISLSALTHQLQYRLGLPQWKNHPLNEVQGTAKDRAKLLRQYAAAEDPLAVELLDDQATALGMVLLMVNYVGDYDLLIIGGGITEMVPKMRQRYLQKAMSSYHAHALDGFRGLCTIDFSICGDSASVIGSLANAYE